MKEKKAFLEADLSKVEASKARLIQAVEEGTFTQAEVAKRIEAVRERGSLIRSEVAGITEQLTEGPSEEQVRGKAKMLSRMIDQIYRSPSRLAKMGFGAEETGFDLLCREGRTRTAAGRLLGEMGGRNRERLAMRSGACSAKPIREP